MIVTAMTRALMWAFDVLEKRKEMVVRELTEFTMDVERGMIDANGEGDDG